MLKRNALWLALAAAGLLTGEGYPAADTDEVFVPELAVLDGTFCGTAASPFRNASGLSVAQAGKTEVDPATPAAAAAMPSGTEIDPPLMKGLGTLGYRISTSSAPAQRYFDQGLRLAWGFNHAEALRAFRKAQKLDPRCAMCYWGEAWALGPNINVPMEQEAVASADFTAMQAANIPAKEVVTIAAHVLRARIGQLFSR